MLPAHKQLPDGVKDHPQGERPDIGLRLVQADDQDEDMVGDELRAPSLPSKEVLGKARELYRELIQTALAGLQRRAEEGGENTPPWLACLLDLGALLGVRSMAPEKDARIRSWRAGLLPFSGRALQGGAYPPQPIGSN
jgi:hypothetical protein